MSIKYSLPTVLMALAIGACQASAPATDQKTHSPTASESAMESKSPSSIFSLPTQTGQGSTTNLQAALKKDMAYADLRKLVVDAGWSPVIDPQCKENVGGEAVVCDQLPEVESCSGDGYCVMHFERAESKERLDVTTYGMVEDWNVLGGDSRLNVVEWAFSDISNG